VNERNFALALGQHLKVLRLKAGLTQKEVGVSLGFKAPHAHSYIARLETGRLRHTALHTIVRYTQACGILLDEIGELVDSMELPPGKTSSRPKKPTQGEPDHTPERTLIPHEPERDEGSRRTPKQDPKPKCQMHRLTSALGHWDLSHLFVIGILTLGFHCVLVIGAWAFLWVSCFPRLCRGFRTVTFRLTCPAVLPTMTHHA